MKDTPHFCDLDRLRKLLDGSDENSLADPWIEHVETCASCREQLETLAASDDWWRDTRDSLDGLAPFAPTLWDDGQFSDDQVGDVRGVSLTFLDKSDNPAMLGRLGEFEIIEPIGCGGMGIVLKGYDHELNRFVAVKVLHPHCATSGAARRRFVREAQAAAAVVHPHVIAIHAVDPSHHPPYLVMPYVPGESLQQRLDREGPFPVVEVLRIGQQIAAGLAAAHAQGLVHRDIKPANVLLERNVDRVLLTDFGLARAADDASLTRSGMIAGTPQYMSPEQARGEAADPRSDLFSLGSLLYALLAGHSPFRAETSLGILRRVTDDTPRKLREISPDTPEWLEVLIARLHQKSPEDRPESAARVAELLQACLAHAQHPTQFGLPEEVLQWSREAQGRSPRFSPRARFWISVGLAMVVAAGVIMVATSENWFSSQSTAPQSLSHQVSRLPKLAEKANPSVDEHTGQADTAVAEGSYGSFISPTARWELWDDQFEQEYRELREQIESLERHSAKIDQE